MTERPMGNLRRALDLRAARSDPARFWLRDDDAIEPTPALDHLLGLSAENQIPLTLAVIPAFTGTELATALRPLERLGVAVHGWSHRSYAEPGQKNQELGPHRPPEVVLNELSRGFSHLSALYGPQFVPVLVPPWNRIDARLYPALANLGFRAVSVFGPETPSAPRQINTHVDLIDWRGQRGTKPEAQLVAEIIARMQVGTMGFLTHHLVHDAAGWDFLTALFAATANHPGCQWHPAAALIPA